MRITSAPAAPTAKSAPDRRDWRPLTTGEAVVTVVVDALLLIVVVLVPLLALGSRALPWILLIQVIVVQSLVLARFGRTVGLATVSATVVVPQQGAAPGIGRALVRVLLLLLLPFRVGRSAAAGRREADGERLLDRLTGTLTVTRRPAPSQERQYTVAQTPGEPRRTGRISKLGTPSSAGPGKRSRRIRRDERRRRPVGSVASDVPMLQPHSPHNPLGRERPDLAGPVYARATGDFSAPMSTGPAAPRGSNDGNSRFAPPASPPEAATPPSAPAARSTLPEVSGASPTPSVFAAPSPPPGTSSMPTPSASAKPSVSFNGPPPPVEMSAPLPPSLPPRIQPARKQTVSPAAPSGGSVTSAAGGAPVGHHGGPPGGALGTFGGSAASPQAQPPVAQQFSAASYPQQQPATPPGSGVPDTPASSGSPSAQTGARRRGRSDAQRRRPMVS